MNSYEEYRAMDQLQQERQLEALRNYYRMHDKPAVSWELLKLALATVALAAAAGLFVFLWLSL